MAQDSIWAATDCSAIASSLSNSVFLPIAGGLPESATEIDKTITSGVGGTISKLAVFISVNACTVANLVRVRKNGANGNCSVSITALTTGAFIDNSNSDTVAVDDELCLEFTTATTGLNTLTMAYLLFTSADNNTYQCFNAMDPGGTAFSSTTNSFFVPNSSVFNSSTTEDSNEISFKHAVTISRLHVYIPTNTRNGQYDLDIRKNNADGSGSIAVASSTTGYFEDTSNTDSYAVDDEGAIEQDMAGTTGSVTVMQMGYFLTSNDGKFDLVTGMQNVPPFNSATTYFVPVTGGTTAPITANEANIALTSPIDFTWSNLKCYVQASIDVETLVRSRVNLANGNQLLTITATTTGYFEDTSNTDAVTAGDEISYTVIVGKDVGDSLAFKNISSMGFTSAPPAAGGTPLLMLMGVGT